MTTPGSSTDTYADNAAFWIKIIREGLDPYRTELTDDAMLTAVGQCAGLDVLDGGCGEGYMSRLLAARGARVVGIDTSSTLIEAAERYANSSSSGSTYYVASLEKIPEGDKRFDVVVLNHVLSDISDPEVALREVGRVLRPGGRLVALMLHPCFYTAHAERDAKGNLPVTTYFARRRVDQSFIVAGIESPAEVHMNFRPLEFYATAIVRSGFAITGMAEPHPPLEELHSDTWWARNFTKPLFLLLTCERLHPD